MNNANNTNSQAVKTFTLKVACMGNFCVKGATHTAHVSGYRKNFGDSGLTKQFEAIRTAGAGVLKVTLAQYKKIASFAFATKKND